jgi:hypothetical protein
LPGANTCSFCRSGNEPANTTNGRRYCELAETNKTNKYLKNARQMKNKTDAREESLNGAKDTIQRGTKRIWNEIKGNEYKPETNIQITYRKYRNV